MVYLFIILYCLILGYFYQHNHTAALLRTPYWILFFYVVVLFGLRFRVGMDTLNYMDSYHLVTPLNQMTFSDLFGQHYAPLSQLLFSFCRMLSPEFYVLQIIHMVLLNIPLFLFLKRQTLNPYYAYLLFFIMAGTYFYTDILRESLAIAVFLLNYENLKNRRWLPYYLLCIVSIGFHYTALFLLFLPLLRNVKFNTTYLLVILAFVAVCMLLLPRLSNLISDDILANEISNKTSKFGLVNIRWFLFRLIRYSLLSAILLFLSRKESEYHFEISLVCIYLLMGIGVFFFEEFFVRFSNYLSLPFVVLMCNYICRRTTAQLLKQFIIIPFLIVNIWVQLHDNYYVMYLPYYSIFNPQIDFQREATRDFYFT